MAGNKTLIAYETKSGATEESAKKIADGLRSMFQLEVDLVDLSEQKVGDLSQYNNVVVGAGVRAGRVYNKALKFLENDFTGKKVAFFVSCGQGGDPEKCEQAKVRFAEETLVRYPNIDAVAWAAFGGRMKILGKKIFDNLDLAKVDAWVDELGKKFTQ
jgi:menaquinone-dependent protoporphyrinogen IX oxidase